MVSRPRPPQQLWNLCCALWHQDPRPFSPCSRCTNLSPPMPRAVSLRSYWDILGSWMQAWYSASWRNFVAVLFPITIRGDYLNGLR